MQENLNFGQAIEALKQGKRVSRKGWDAKGMFVFRQVPSLIPKDAIQKMQSLPQSVKDEFARRGGDISYSDQLALVKPYNAISGYSPSTADALSSDWVVLD